MRTHRGESGNVAAAVRAGNHGHGCDCNVERGGAATALQSKTPASRPAFLCDYALLLAPPGACGTAGALTSVDGPLPGAIVIDSPGLWSG